MYNKIPHEINVTREEVAKATARLENLLTKKDFSKVEDVADLGELKYKFGIAGIHSGQITLIFKTPEFAKPIKQALIKRDIRIEPGEKPNEIKAFVPNILKQLPEIGVPLPPAPAAPPGSTLAPKPPSSSNK